MQLRTMLGGRKGGFFIPYRHADAVQPPQRYPEIEAMLDRAAPDFVDLLQRASSHGRELAAFAGPAPTPRFDQDWFPRLDAAIAYALVRERRPERIVEIGSGHSTRFLAQALADAGGGRMIAFDPAPRAPLDGLPITLNRRLFGEDDVALTASLGPGDILFVDSSHIAMPGTDVDLLVSRIVPSLTQGVLLHVHDVFLPDGYPDSWAWRGYNEQLIVAALLAGRAFTPVFASHYVVTRLAAQVQANSLATLPLLPSAFETSFWLERR